MFLGYNDFFSHISIFLHLYVSSIKSSVEIVAVTLCWEKSSDADALWTFLSC